MPAVSLESTTNHSNVSIVVIFEIHLTLLESTGKDNMFMQ